MKFFKTLFACIILIIASLAYLFGTGFLMETYYMHIYGKDSIFYTCHPLYLLQVIAYLLFIVLIIYMWTKWGFWGDMEDQCTWNRQKKIKVTILSFLTLIVVNLVCSQWYTKVDLDGVELHHFGHVREYTWQDAVSYSLHNAHDGTLGVKITMKNKRHIELLYTSMTTYSDGYSEAFPHEDYDFFPWLAHQLKETGCPLKIKNEKKLIDKLSYSSWKELAEEIIDIAK